MSELTSPGPTSDFEASDSLVFSCHHDAFSAYYEQAYSMSNVQGERGEERVCDEGKNKKEERRQLLWRVSQTADSQ